MKKINLEERFWTKVHKSDRCWIWLANKDKWGYGKIWRDDKMVLAAPVAYEMQIGPIPEGLFPFLLCHCPACVNPSHMGLFPKGQHPEESEWLVGFNGAYMDKDRGKWMAMQHTSDLGRCFLGEYDSQLEAYEAYEYATALRFGHLAVTQSQYTNRLLAFRGQGDIE
jgi:hypothetical protein